MCLAIPGQVMSVSGEEATIDYGGIGKQANVSLLSDLKPGDWVLVHVGFAIEKIDEDVARETYNLLAEFDEPTVG